MEEKKVLEILGECGAVLTNDHFVYTSGLHGSVYVNKDAVYPHPKFVAEFCEAIAEHFCQSKVEVVVGPEKGGIILETLVALKLNEVCRVPAIGVYAEKGEKIFAQYKNKDEQWVSVRFGKDDIGHTLKLGEELIIRTGNFVFKRGYDQLVKDKNILIVEDILTTGGSVKKVIETVQMAGGKVVGVGALVNRGGVTPSDLGLEGELFSLLNITLETFKAEDCPQCKDGVPINNKVGHGAKK